MQHVCMHCNNFKPPPTGWDQPEKADAMPHVTSGSDLNC